MGQPGGHSLPFYALASWLLTELIGALMVRSWMAGGGVRAARQTPPRSDAMSLPVLAGHAGLNLAGLVCWVCFVLSGATALAWLALAFMAPAIGLGISTLTIWTPYPAVCADPEPDGGRREPGVLSASEVARALGDEELSQKLVDELLRANLAPLRARKPQWSLRPLVPLAHGVLALATFLLALLAAIAAI
jgi:hypothetical protein